MLQAFAVELLLPVVLKRNLVARVPIPDTDQLYALLTVWQAQFGLSYMGLAIVRALYCG